MSVPTSIVDLANACRASVLATVGFELDFEPETLPVLDHYVKNYERLAASAGGASDSATKAAPGQELLELLAPMCGAYYGEVLRHHFDGALRWHAPDDERALWRLEAEPVFLFFSPVDLALEVITQEDVAGGHLRVRTEDREAVRGALDTFGEVRDADYYSFTVRYEVFEQVLETLGRRARERDERRRFEAADYDAFVVHDR